MGYACKLGGTSSDIKISQGNYYQSYYGSDLNIDVGIEFNFLSVYGQNSAGFFAYLYDAANGIENRGCSNSTYISNFMIIIGNNYYTHKKPNSTTVNGTYYYTALII